MTQEQEDRIENALAIVKIVAFFGMLAILGAAALKAEAAPAVDQTNTTIDTTVSWGTATNGGNTRTVCQSFVPDQTKVMQIDTAFSVVGACTYIEDSVKFYLSSGACKGQGGDTTLSSHALTSDEWTALTGSSPFTASWTLDSAVTVTPGTTYYISMRDETARNLCYRTSDNSTSSYADGIERRGGWTDTFTDQTRDLYFSTYYDALSATIDATNFPASAGGIRYEGEIQPASELEAGEYIINAYVTITSGNTGHLTSFLLRSSEIESATGTFETADAVEGTVWPPGDYDVCIVENTTERAITACDTVTVVPFVVQIGAGGGSWGSDGLPEAFTGAPGLSTPSFVSYGTCFELSLSAFGCFFNVTKANLAGLPLINFMAALPNNVAYATGAATATVQLYIPVPAVAGHWSAGGIMLFDSTSSTAGIMGQATTEFWTAVRNVETIALYLLAGFLVILIILDFRKAL